MTSSAFQRTFQHLVTANALLNDYPPLPPPLHPAPLPITPAGPTPPSPSPSETNYEAVTTDPSTGYKQRSLLHTLVRRLMMLAMVPTNDVPDAFNAIVDNIPDTLDMDPLLGYYEKTWIVGLSGRRARFPPESWNQTDRVETDLNRTNNYCESFNKTFADVVGHSNPTIFNFLSAVQLEQASTESKISCYRQGRQPPKRRKRWIEKDASIKRIVVNFHQYENRVLEYLDELAEL